MEPNKMSPAQLAKFVAEGKKQKADVARWKALQKDQQELGKGSKLLAQIASQNPTV
jgi:hypothetical protein